MMDSDLGPSWTTPFLQNILYAWPFIVGLLISILALPRFMLQYWLTVQELDELTLARGSQRSIEGTASENSQTHSEPAAVKDSNAFVFAFIEPGIVPTWRVNSFWVLTLLLWAYFEQPKLSFGLLYPIILTVGMRNIIFRNLGYAIRVQKAFVMRKKGDRAWIIYSETKARPILIALATGISLGAFLLHSKVLGAMCVPFILSKLTMDMTFRKRFITRFMKNLLIFWIFIFLVATGLQLPQFSTSSQKRRGGDQEKLEEGFFAEIHLWNGKMSLGVLTLLWVLVLEIVSICYRIDYQQIIDNAIPNKDIQPSPEFPGNPSRPSFISKLSNRNISKPDSGEIPEGLAGALPLKPAPIILSTYYLTTLAAWVFSWIITLWICTVDDDSEVRVEGLGLCFVCLWITSFVMPTAVFAVAWFRGEWGILLKYEEKWVGGDSQSKTKVPGENLEISLPMTNV